MVKSIKPIKENKPQPVTLVLVIYKNNHQKKHRVKSIKPLWKKNSNIKNIRIIFSDQNSP